jgi:hypothetical protein
MAFPYREAFGALFLLYLVYSFWQRIDPRYPIAAALLLLVATALVEAGGATDAADTLAEYVFVLLVGGAVLLLVERLRPDPSRPGRSGERAVPPVEDPSHPTDEGQGPAEHPLHDVQEEPVAPVDAPGRENGQDEPPRDAQAQDR